MTAKPPSDKELEEVLDTEEEIAYEDEQGESAVEWEQLPPEREFFATPYDPPVKSLIQEMRENELIVRPTFQRYAVWDRARKSKFVESILLNIPIPNLFFAEDEDGSKVVVDGQQRLTALKEFTENKFPLTGIEVLGLLKNKRFDDLTEKQRKIIRNRTLRCLVISAKSDSEIRFQIFERLNQGGVPLNAQEVRHCVYRGSLNDLLHELVKTPMWLNLLGLSEPHRRMNDCELVLRFFALRDSLPNYRPPLKRLLNNFMRDKRHLDAAAVEELRDAFKQTVENVRAAFGVVAFRRLMWVGKEIKIDKVPNRAVFDIQVLLFEPLPKQWIIDNQEKIVTAFANLFLNNTEFVDAVSKATADKTRLKARLSAWHGALQALGAPLPPGYRIPL